MILTSSLFVKFRGNEYQLLWALGAGEAVFTCDADILKVPLAALLTQQVTRVVSDQTWSCSCTTSI